MNIRDSILRLIDENLLISVPIEGESDLYTDLGFDSLAFITLLTQIEAVHGVTFEISEMEACLNVDTLIATVEKKIKEKKQR